MPWINFSVEEKLKRDDGKNPLLYQALGFRFSRAASQSVLLR
jgi:hypothetical protein